MRDESLSLVGRIHKMNPVPWLTISTTCDISLLRNDREYKCIFVFSNKNAVWEGLRFFNEVHAAHTAAFMYTCWHLVKLCAIHLHGLVPNQGNSPWGIGGVIVQGCHYGCWLFNTLWLRQNGRHFPDIFRCVFLNQNVWILLKISLKFVSKVWINIPALVQMMAWHRPGDNPLSETMMVWLPMHIRITRPNWPLGVIPKIDILNNSCWIALLLRPNDPTDD